MTKIFQFSLIASIAAASLLPMAANAQSKCTEGVAANGDCVDPAIGNAARQSAVILTQPKISFTAYPILPTGDYDYRYPHQLNPNQQPPSSTGTPIPPPNP